MSTETEIKTQSDHDETMRRTRIEFSQAWPAIWKQVAANDKKAIMPPIHQAAWLGF